MRYPEFMIAFVVIPFLISSLPSHIRGKNVAVIALIVWTAVLDLIRGINAVVWANDAIIRLVVWCDITTKITIGWIFAVPLAMLCLCQHLEQVASNRGGVATDRDKRRRVIYESIMCFGVPLIFMALHYLSQGHRFDIYENLGCYPATYFTPVALVFTYLPPFIIAFVTMGYAIAALYHFFKRRLLFTSILKGSNTSLSQSHYFRLMGLAFVEIIWDFGLNSWVLALNFQDGLRPWISWENVHFDFSRIGQFPHVIIPTTRMNELIAQWWILPISSFGIFFFFAFGEEAMSDYRKCWIWIRRVIFRKSDTSTSSCGEKISDLPMYIASPLPVTRLKGGNKKDTKHDDAPWEKLNINITMDTETSSFTSAGTTPSESFYSEKRLVVEPCVIAEPAPVYVGDHRRPSDGTDLGIRVSGPYLSSDGVERRPSEAFYDDEPTSSSSSSLGGTESRTPSIHRGVNAV